MRVYSPSLDFGRQEWMRANETLAEVARHVDRLYRGCSVRVICATGTPKFLDSQKNRAKLCESVDMWRQSLCAMAMFAQYAT